MLLNCKDLKVLEGLILKANIQPVVVEKVGNTRYAKFEYNWLDRDCYKK